MGKNLTPSGSEPVKGSPAVKEVRLSLFTAAVSATLRMVVPTLGLFFTGLIIDFTLQQPAFYAVIGAICGFVVAVILIYFQIKKLRTKSITKPSQEKR